MYILYEYKFEYDGDFPELATSSMRHYIVDEHTDNIIYEKIDEAWIPSYGRIDKTNEDNTIIKKLTAEEVNGMVFVDQI